MKFLKSPEELNKLGAGEAAKAVKGIMLWALVIGLIIFGLLYAFLGVTLEFESPLFLIQQSIRVGLAGFPVAILRSLLSVTLGFCAAQVIENTEFGQRLPSSSKGGVYAAIFITVALAFIVK